MKDLSCGGEDELGEARMGSKNGIGITLYIGMYYAEE